MINYKGNEVALMEYKRKLSTQQEGVSGTDSEFGSLKMIAKSKRMMPIIFTIVMIIFISAIVLTTELSGNMIAVILLIFFSFLALFQLSTLLDKIEFYEYGLIDYTFLNVRKKRLAYDDIDAIVEVKKRFLFKEGNRNVVALWKIHPKAKKNALVIDATAYIGITHMMTGLRHDTKIKNIAD